MHASANSHPCPRRLGHAASAGASAPQPPRATGIRPEFLRISLLLFRFLLKNLRLDIVSRPISKICVFFGGFRPERYRTVGTTCPLLFCMLSGSGPPPCTPLPFCGISCTAGSSTPSSVAAVVLPVLIAVDHSNGAQILRILSPIGLTHPSRTMQRYRCVYEADPVLWPQISAKCFGRRFLNCKQDPCPISGQKNWGQNLK